MVKELMRQAGESWQFLAAITAFLVAIITFSIELGIYQAQVQVNTKRLEVIERHDIETRDIEAKLAERIRALEAAHK